MKYVRETFCNDVYFVGFGIFIALPFIGHAIAGGGFSWQYLIPATLIYTLLFALVAKMMRD